MSTSPARTDGTLGEQPAPGSLPVLDLQGLAKHFRLPRTRGSGIVRAVDGVDLTIGPGEIVGLVGESGCGKSTVGRCIVRLLNPDGGRILLDGTDITHLPGSRMRELRPKVHMVFQDPFSSLNPRMRVADIVGGPLRAQRRASRGQLGAAVGELLQQVGLPAEVRSSYPHQLSGGQRQRVGLARSLAARPKLLVADEPTSALDVSMQAAVLNQLADLQATFGFATLLISHDLSVVEYLCDKVAVMYLGKIVEAGPRDQIFRSPLHPYTQSLLSAIPRTDLVSGTARRPVVLHGELPSPQRPPGGCAFHTRCPVAEMPLCRERVPDPVSAGPGSHWARCHLVQPDGSAPDVAAATRR
jgi:oligopeptide transport system ATP-binding protein